MENLLNMFIQADDVYFRVLTHVLRYLAPCLATILLLRCGLPLMMFRREQNTAIFSSGHTVPGS